MRDGTSNPKKITGKIQILISNLRFSPAIDEELE